MKTANNTSAQIRAQFAQVKTYGELRSLLPETGKGKVPSIKKLSETASVVLSAKTDCGYLEVYDNGFFSYTEDGYTTVYAVDRCAVLKWYSCTGEMLTSKDADMSNLPWTMPLEISGSNRLEHNSGSRQDSRMDLFLDAPSSENNPLFSVRPEHVLRDEADAEKQTQDQTIAAVREALRHMTSRQKEVLLLIHIKRMTQDEVALKLGLSRMAVRTHLDRAEKNLKKFLKSCSHFTP